jgi:hypothetical protein
MKILVISNRHSLFPFAHRLKLEGHDVEILVWKNSRKGSNRWEKAWAGGVDLLLKASEGEISEETLAPVLKAAASGELVVITNSYNAAEIFQDSAYLLSSHRSAVEPVSGVRLGAWWTGTEIQAVHLLVVDNGAWPAGLGPHGVPGALTQIRIENESQTYTALSSLLEPMFDLLARAEPPVFRGLAQFGLTLDRADKQLALAGASLGWPFLHTHSFVSELPDFGGVLAGAKEPTLPYKYTVVAPLSIPPWPNDGAAGAAKVPIKGLTPQWQGRFFWHDMEMNPAERSIGSAGIDGLLGVGVGSGQTFELARARCLELLQTAQVPDKQFRPDLGAQVPMLMGLLEEQFGLVV